MKSKCYIFIGLFFLLESSFAAIYGADNRRDVGELSDKLKAASLAVALNVPSFFLIPDGVEGLLKHEDFLDRQYGSEVGLCKDQRFYNQTSFGHCTSFLVHERIVVSVGHCFLPTGSIQNEAHDYCNNFSFWFGYNTHHNSKLGQKINPKNVAYCKKVIYAENNESEEPLIDVAIFELDRPIKHIKPLSLGFNTAKDVDVFALGHPNGLPLKYSGVSKIIDDLDTTFSANLDTLTGNSGSPVLNRNLEVLGVLVSGHENDYVQRKNCSGINHCDENGLNCDNPSDLDPANYMMKTSHWFPYIKKYLTSFSF